MKRKQNGFTAVEAVLILVLIGIVAGVGWYVMRARKNIDITNSETTNSNATSPDIKISTDTKPVDTKTVTATRFLTINELGVKFALSPGILDASYTKDDFDQNTYFLRTEALKGTDCTGGYLITFQKSGMDSEAKLPYVDEFPDAVKIGDNYFAYGINPANTECSSDKSVQDKANKAAAEFKEAVKTIQPAS